MRRSLAALALIRRPNAASTTDWLLRWNEHWQALNLVGGHKENDETFRACCVREIAEELGLHDSTDVRVAAQPLQHLEFTAWSQRSQEETAYTFELFEVELATPAAQQQVAANPHNRWVTPAEMRAGYTGDNRLISPTVVRVLTEAGLLPSEPDVPRAEPFGNRIP
jgi:ADP-ribose pyrophosphatase YjhB (NUDIX family)